MADYGIKISKSGDDVKTADDKDLVFSSKFNSPKIFASGTATVTTDGSGDGTTSVTHSLGYSPAFKVFCEISGKYYPDPGNYIRRETEGPQSSHAYTDTTKLYIAMDGAGASTAYKFKYFLFVDLAETYSGSGITFSNDYGMKVSKPGIDVFDAKSYELAFSSSFKTLKLYTSGSFTMYLAERHCDWNPNEMAVTEEVAHSLGYPPYFLAYFKSTDAGIYETSSEDRFPVMGIMKVGAGSVPIWVLESRSTDVEVSMKFWRLSQCVDDPFNPPADCDSYCYNWGNETVTVYYYIFEEDITVA